MGFLSNFSWIVLAVIFFSYIFIRGLIMQGSQYYFIKRVGFAITHRVFQLPFAQGQLANEFRANLRTALIDAAFFASIVRVFPLYETGSWGAILSFSISALWFEIWFYFSHRMLHTKALMFIHQQHHVAKVTSPLTALSFSVSERLIILSGGLIPLFVLSEFMPLSSAGITTYLLFNYGLNLMGHMNVEFFPPQWLKSPLGRILNTPSYHALHHARYRGHFGLFTPYLDSLFKTRFKDYEEVQKRSYQGEGLHALSQRLKEGL